MKRIFVIFLTLLLLGACQEKNNIVNPDHNTEEHLSKSDRRNAYDQLDNPNPNDVQSWTWLNDGTFSGVDNGSVSYNEFLTVIKIGNGKNAVYEVVYDENKVVNVDVEFSWYYEGNNWRTYKANLAIEGRDIDWDCGSDLITGSGNDRILNFNVIYSTTDLTADFYPTPFTFANPITLNMTWENVDETIFNEIMAANQFAFVDSDNSFVETVEYGSITFNTNKRNIELSGAQIPHFSRYGFLR